MTTRPIPARSILPSYVFRPLLAILLAGSLTTLAGASVIDNALTGQKEINGLRNSRVETFTPQPVGTKEMARSKVPLNNAPAPFTTIRLGALDSKSSMLKQAQIKRPSLPLQVGLGRGVTELATGKDLLERLRWTENATGAQQAAIRFVSAGAVGTRLALNVTQLDPRTKLRFYGANNSSSTEILGTDVIDTVSRNQVESPTSDSSRIYFGPYIEGEEVTLEIEIPADISISTLRINVPRLSHLFSSPIAEPIQSRLGGTGSCTVDVACRTDWVSTGNGIARMVFSSSVNGASYFCTGTLLNDTASSRTPYFLTANHCIRDQATASTVQTFWFYRASSCGSGSLLSESQTRAGGGTLLHTNGLTDATLLRLNSAPPAGVSFVGWSSYPVDVAAPTGAVHHPAGNLQKVNLGAVTGYQRCQENGESFSCVESSLASGSHLSTRWSSGVTEGGSSGSGLFQETEGKRYLVGQLSGGSSSCSNTSGMDIYGRYDLAYQSGLHRWLDVKPAVTRSPIYRFYNIATGAHFFTANRDERDFIIATYPQFSYEGPAFYAYAETGPGLSAVYRFFNTSTGAHFFTSSSQERDHVVATYPAFRFEGTAWFAQPSATQDSNPMYRFYNTATSSHFYTVNLTERDHIRQTYPAYSYEGVAYHAWTAE